MRFIWDISSSPPISSHKKRDNVLCPQWKPRLICQIQLQSIVIQPCGLKTVCAEVVFRGRLSGSDTRQRMVLLFQSHERDSRIRWGVQFFFFPFAKPVGIETQGDWLELQKKLHKPKEDQRESAFESKHFCVLALGPVYFPVFSDTTAFFSSHETQ